MTSSSQADFRDLNYICSLDAQRSKNFVTRMKKKTGRMAIGPTVIVANENRFTASCLACHLHVLNVKTADSAMSMSSFTSAIVVPTTIPEVHT